MNLVTLIGRLTREVEIRTTQSGLTIASFTLAVDKGLSKDKKAEFESMGKATADFIPITAFGKTAEIADRYLAKGNRVAIQGRIDVNHYEKDGERKTFTSVLVDRLELIESSGTSGERPAQTNQTDTNSLADSNLDSSFDFPF